MYGMSKLLPLNVMSDKLGSSWETKAQMALGSSPMSLSKNWLVQIWSFVGFAIPSRIIGLSDNPRVSMSIMAKSWSWQNPAKIVK